MTLVLGQGSLHSSGARVLTQQCVVAHARSPCSPPNVERSAPGGQLANDVCRHVSSRTLRSAQAMPIYRRPRPAARCKALQGRASRSRAGACDHVRRPTCMHVAATAGFGMPLRTTPHLRWRFVHSRAFVRRLSFPGRRGAANSLAASTGRAQCVHTSARGAAVDATSLAAAKRVLWPGGRGASTGRFCGRSSGLQGIPTVTPRTMSSPHNLASVASCSRAVHKRVRGNCANRTARRSLQRAAAC